MKYVMLSLLLTALYCCSAFAQKQTGDAKTQAPCSPAVTGGDNNTFIFKYCGDPEEGQRILRLLKAVAEGESLANGKLDEILALLNKPTKIVMFGPPVVTSPQPRGHPQTTVKFYTEDPVDRGQFEIKCDRACTPVNGCRLLGGNALRLAIVKGYPEIAEFLFQRQFPSLTQCDMTVESQDDTPVTIVGIKTSNRITDLDFNLPQPNSCVVAGGSVLC
jgi:hypothetical protein